MVDSASLFERAQDVIPGGSTHQCGRSSLSVARLILSNALKDNSFGSLRVGVIWITLQSWGASILGHAHPHVINAITEAAARGDEYGAPTENEVLLAEAIRDRVPWM